MTPDVVLAKLGAIERFLHRIRKVTKNDPASVHDQDVQDIVVLNLQRAIQSATDLAAHIISEGSWGLPDSLKAHFTLLANENVIDTDLCRRRLEAMVGFRNVAVHAYETIDADVLERIVPERMGDLEEFSRAVKQYAARPKQP